MKLSPQMIRMLDDVNHGLGTHSTAMARGEHAGRYRTARALRERGLMDCSCELTDAGRAALRSATRTAAQSSTDQQG